ncbi:wax ester synthase/diacylglycerol acyltransferase 11-like [Malania oleifera]|uniref:wax ester synthase/diacylglycerol acyltransferase 11-like n=1 Tax=Malania oleifera TaxID=397392 RepID=UPI0025ADC1DB|nr:wax ester synthase/diacylglycerol acyltransferase 11-like [Malania oleifera]
MEMESSSGEPWGLRSLRLRKPPTDGDSAGGSSAGYAAEEKGEPLSPAGRLFHSPNFNCCIVAIMGCRTEINPVVIKAGLVNTLLKHPRFSGKLVIDGKKGGKKRWVRTTVNLDDHITIPDLDPNVDAPDKFVEDYVSNLTKIPMDLSKPLWELHILNIKTSDANAVGIFRIHHSIGDGVSLISVLLACTRKTSDPEALPTIPTQKRAGSRSSCGFWQFLKIIWLVFKLFWNTFVDVLFFVATMIFLKDKDTPIKGAPNVGWTVKRFVHRTVSLDEIKLVKNATNATINDVILGVTHAGLAQYLSRRYGERESNKGAAKKGNNLPKRIRLRSALLVNIRPSAGIEEVADMMMKSKFKWGNWIGYILLPFPIALQDDPLEYIHRAKATIDRKKLSLEPILTYTSAKLLLNIFGVKVAAALIHRVLSNTTMSFSNVVGPVEEISFCGHPLAYLAPSVYGHPHALTVHFQSYMNKMTIVAGVDQDVIPDPHKLCDDFEESLKLIKNAAVEKGLIKNDIQ